MSDEDTSRLVYFHTDGYSPCRKFRVDERQDTGWDVKVKSVEFSKRTLHGKWDKLLQILTLGLYKPVPCFVKVDTGVSVQAVDTGIGFQLRMNSRASKTPFVLGNAIGTIDPGYTGNIMAIFNVLSWATWDDINSYFKEGAVIGQLVPERQVEIVWLKLDRRPAATDRSTGGFGSTAG